MKTEQEIVLQKKMIIIFSMIILSVVMGILNLKKSEAKVSMLDDEETTKICTVYNADKEYFTIEESGEALNSCIVEEFEENVSDEEAVVNEETILEEKEVQPVEEKEENIQPEHVVSRGAYIRDTNVPPTEYERVVTVKATAYCLCKKCCGKSPDSPSYGNTASGLKIIPNTGMKVIAVDTNVVPLGTEVYIEGLNGASNYGYAIAADTGSAIKNNKIDLYMDTHEQALAWGVKTVNMYILGN